ncbi:MAG: HAD family phosphatase [Anaerolineae bacterium]|nr:HAD family phosphatase [Anaerolineae bacterium]
MTRQTSTPTAIFFDLGRVLVTFDWEFAIPRLAAHNGGDAERIREFLAHPFHDDFERNQLTGDEFFERGRAMTGFTGTQREFQTYWNEIFTELPENVRLFRQVAELYPVYALSNTNPWHARYLEQTFEWMGLFRARYYSFVIGARKPDPIIYHQALNLASVSADQVLFVDDRRENVETALALGIQALHLSSPDLLAPLLQKFSLVPERT